MVMPVYDNLVSTDPYLYPEKMTGDHLEEDTFSYPISPKSQMASPTHSKRSTFPVPTMPSPKRSRSTAWTTEDVLCVGELVGDFGASIERLNSALSQTNKDGLASNGSELIELINAAYGVESIDDQAAGLLKAEMGQFIDDVLLARKRYNFSIATSVATSATTSE